MRENYEKIRGEIEEIKNLIKRKMTESNDLISEDPDLVALMLRCNRLLVYSDNFTMAHIDAMENQNKKLDEILSKLN